VKVLSTASISAVGAVWLAHGLSPIRIFKRLWANPTYDNKNLPSKQALSFLISNLSLLTRKKNLVNT